MTDRLPRILDHLAPLVAADTRNPPRAITPDHPLLIAIRAALPSFEIDVTDHGEGSLVIDARRGEPSVLFNVHMDTVPTAEGWSRDPHDLHRGETRATGLGACDIKGAAAVLMTLAEDTDAPMRLVLTTDEEAGQSTCIRRFLESPPGVSLAVVAEPTEARAVTRHRGIVSARTVFGGESGHASQGGRSAVHQAARWIADASSGDLAAETRLNFGRIEGGVKPNMVAASCEVLYGFRPRPGEDAQATLRAIQGRAKDAEHHPRFVGPAMPSDADGRSAKAQGRASEAVETYGLAPGPQVDFWTEASLFSEAGIPALVLGPGDIAQAHTADEWVAYETLLATFDAYERIALAEGP